MCQISTCEPYSIGQLKFNSENNFSLFTLLTLLNANLPTLGFVTNISIGSGYTYQVSPSEAIFLGIVYFKIYLLRFLGLLPVSLNHLTGKLHFFDKPEVPPGYRKKRESDPSTVTSEQIQMAETILGLVRKLDTKDCFIRTLCELRFRQNQKENEVQISPEVQYILTVLEKRGQIRSELKSNNTDTAIVENPAEPPETIEDRPIISFYEEAILIGKLEQYKNVTYFSNECEEKYSLCDLDTVDLLKFYSSSENFIKKIV